MVQPDLVPQPKSGRYRLGKRSDFWLAGLSGSKRWLVVDAGATTDGASIPRLLWPIIGSPFDADLILAAFVHDMLYAAQLTTRAEADAVLLALLADNGVGVVRRQAIHKAVRSFGWWRWHRAKAGVEKARESVRWGR